MKPLDSKVVTALLVAALAAVLSLEWSLRQEWNGVHGLSGPSTPAPNRKECLEHRPEATSDSIRGTTRSALDCAPNGEQQK